MKTTVEIPDALFREAKRYAAAHDLTLKEIVERGVRQVIAAEAVKPFKLRRIPYRPKKGGMVKDFTWDEIRDIIYEGHGT
jgi:hypothetical protein